MSIPGESCGHNDFATLYRAPAFDIAAGSQTPWLDVGRCRQCGIVFTIGVAEAEIEAAYSSEYYGSPAQKFSPVIEHILSRLATRRAQKIISRWRERNTSTATPDVLDIGCGRGILLRSFHAMGANVLGLEREGFPIHDSVRDLVSTRSLSDAQFADRRFDIVILWHVLEHISCPEELLGEISRHMNENGLLVIAVPNFDSWQRKLFGPYWFHLDLPRHLVHLEPGWLRKRLELLGYRVEHVSYLEPIQAVYGFLQSTFNVAAPSRLNECYTLLKHGHHGARSVPRLAVWIILGVLLTPFALIESILGALAGKGATITVMARLEK